MTEINPKIALGWTWFNSYLPGGDDGDIVDPGLPIPPGSSGSEGGSGGGRGSSSREVSYPPDLWSGSYPEIRCLPPCNIILPPWPLGQTTTITFPRIVISVWTRSGGSTGSKTTTILVPPLVTDAVPFYPITLASDVSAATVFYPLQSFMPPPTVISLGADEATFAPVPRGGAIPAPSFPGTPYPITIQPQATSSI
jgi:chitinase